MSGKPLSGLSFILTTAMGVGLQFPCHGVSLASDYKPAIGELHPRFTLPSIDNGRPISLAKYRGHKVLLIHFASW